MVLGLTISLVELKGVSLSAAARSAAALVKDKLTPNCHLTVLAVVLRYEFVRLFSRVCALGRRPRAKRAGDGTAQPFRQL